MSATKVVHFQLAVVIAASFLTAQGQFLSGTADIFIVSNDTDREYEPYSLIYEGSRMYKLSEFVLSGINDITRFHIVYFDSYNLIDITIALNLDEVRKYTTNQNLEKELFFAHYNSSGIFPQMIITNTTKQEILLFHANNNSISYYADWYTGEFTNEMTPPFDLVIEVPGYSNSMKATRTLIDIQSIPILGFQLGVDPPVTFHAIAEGAESLIPLSFENLLIWNMTESTIRVIPNPCIQDFFLVYIMVGHNDAENITGNAQQRRPSPIHTFFQIPAFYSFDNDGCWFNLTSIYCPTLEFEEECGVPEDIILTNKVMMVLSSRGLFVSNDLSKSKYKLSERVAAAPYARFTAVDPCYIFDIKCFQTGSQSQEDDLIYNRKIHYTPFCNVHHYPVNLDMVIFVLEHSKLAIPKEYDVLGVNASVPVKAFSIAFSAYPYTKWHPLFKSQVLFENHIIKQIVGIFFNPHKHRFDVTIQVAAQTNSSDHRDRFVRFILPMPENTPYMDGYPHLDGTWGHQQGFLTHLFSEAFDMTGIAVNTGTMDIFFYGSEIHIAESGRSIVYESAVGFVESDDFVTGCHFNHPDRFYVCSMHKKHSILIGRVATWYGPVEVELSSLAPIQGLVDSIFTVYDKRAFAAKTLGKPFTMSDASQEVMFYLLERAIFTASYSGKIYLWYFSDPEYFFVKIRDYDEECREPHEQCRYDVTTRPTKVPGLNYSLGCGEETCFTLPCLLPLVMDPGEFQVQNNPTHGPLVPFFIHPESVILYEAYVPGSVESSMRYLTFVSIGQRIYCHKERRSNDLSIQTAYSCDLYFRHLKFLKTISTKVNLLPGFRSAVYATVVKPPPMTPIQDYFLVQIPENTNRVRILCADKEFKLFQKCQNISFEDVGGTIYIPGHFSVLILGQDWQITNSFRGLATHKTVLPISEKIQPYRAFKTFLRSSRFVDAANEYNVEEPHLPPSGTFGCENGPPTPCNTVFDEFNVERADTDVIEWEIGDGGCQFEMFLVPNSFIFASGGRIDLDLHESASFAVSIRSLTALGKKMLYRPLLFLTQSNPEVLKVSTKSTKKPDRQTLSIFMQPTGSKQGVTSLVIRSVVSSISCKTPSSFTLFVQCVRSHGKKLIVNYPKTDTDAEFLKLKKPASNENKIEALKLLPTNYRPPSFLGTDIPLTTNIYNADPSKPLYNSWYKKSKRTAKFKQCHLQKNREECRCSAEMKLSRDPAYSDCIEKVVKVYREQEFKISLHYPSRQLATDQIEQFYTPPTELVVIIKEINGRTDYIIQRPSQINDVIAAINNDETLSSNHTYYLASEIRFSLYGTGLYHFKATLARFHTFDEVSAYVLVYSDTNELDDVFLIMIIVGTMMLCFLFVFFGFMRVRRLLIAHYPVQLHGHTKQKMA